MNKIKDISGQKFGNLTVLRLVDRSSRGITIWECQCDCGFIKTVYKSNLTTGNTKTCCRKECEFSKQIKQTNLDHGLSRTREYQVWVDMIRRCYDPNSFGYKNYGMKNICVCDRWKDNFLDFYNDMQLLSETREDFEKRTGMKATFDRIDPSGNYELNNVRWVSYETQNQNKLNNVINEHIVKCIISEYILNNLSAIQIIRKFNLPFSRFTISQIIHRKSWKNINIRQSELNEYKLFQTINGQKLI